MDKPKYVRNASTAWTPQEEKKLVQLAAKNTPTRVIGVILGRSVGGVYAKARQLDVSLRPTNRSPYNRRKK